MYVCMVGPNVSFDIQMHIYMHVCVRAGIHICMHTCVYISCVSADF